MNAKLNSTNHPTREELTRHIFAETAGEPRASLEAHLSECHACAKHAADMQETLSWLNRWQIPAASCRRGFNWQPLKWAAAAAVLLSAGLGLSRFTAPAVPDIPALRAEIRADLAHTIAVEIQNQIGPAVQAQLLAPLAGAREEDHAYVLALFRNLQLEQASQYVSLRNDLETLATLTEEEILNTRRSIFHVAVAETAAGEFDSK